MAEKVVVTGIPAFDGEYPLDLGGFTNRELQIVKRMSGVRLGEIEEALGAGDNDVALAIAVIAVRRSGKAWQAFEALAWEANAGAITLDLGDEADAVPPPIPLPTLKPSEKNSGPSEPGSELSPSDGDDPQETNLRAIGSQA